MRDQYYSQTCEAFQQDCMIVNNVFLSKKAWSLWVRPQIIYFGDGLNKDTSKKL